MAALALAAGAGTGNAVEVVHPRERDFPPLAAPPPRSTKRRRVKRLNARVAGGNWQGKQYLSYAEHDRCVRATFGAPHEVASAVRYDMERRAIIASR